MGVVFGSRGGQLHHGGLGHAHVAMRLQVPRLPADVGDVEPPHHRSTRLYRPWRLT